jgi:hypothetical protein
MSQFTDFTICSQSKTKYILKSPTEIGLITRSEAISRGFKKCERIWTN